MTYLRQVGNPNNYLVIDFEDSVINNFDSDKVIIVNQFGNGLTDELVDNYLDLDIETNNCNLEDTNFLTEDILQNI